jgi:hypothetical protein
MIKLLGPLSKLRFVALLLLASCAPDRLGISGLQNPRVSPEGKAAIVRGLLHEGQTPEEVGIVLGRIGEWQRWHGPLVNYPDMKKLGEADNLFYTISTGNNKFVIVTFKKDANEKFHYTGTSVSTIHRESTTTN